MRRSEISGAHEQRVTASELVRQFGLWQERAARAPVYVLHRGRPRLVLTSIDVMDALCASHGGEAAEAEARLAALLDAVRDIVLLLDTRGGVVAASRQARALFADDLADIHPAARLGGPILVEALDRTVATGIAETIELRPTAFPDRHWSCEIAPFPRGVALFVRDVTDAARLRDADAAATAKAAAILAAGGIATARIGLRGYLEDAGAALANLTGLDREALGKARFVSLFEIGSRVAVGDTMEAVLSGALPVAGLRARLLVNRGAPSDVRLGLAPIRHGGAIEAASAIVAIDAGAPRTP